MKTSLSVPLSVLVSTLSLFQGSPAQAQEITPYSPKDERKLLGPRYEGRLVPLAQMNHLTEETEGDTLIFIHGRSGSIKNFTQLLLNTPKFIDYQLYYFAYDDLHRSLKRSAGDLAMNILKIKAPRITIIAHSMGGLIAREALNTLSRAGHEEHLPQIRVISIDSPWQGGGSINSSNKGANLDDMVEYFMPAALADMRSCSEFFKQLYKVNWPKQFGMELYFAQQGTQSLDHTEAPINRLPEKIANLFENNTPMKGSLYEMNFWNALSTSSQYPAFVNELSALHDHAKLTAQDVTKLLEKHYPRFPGDHASVLNMHPNSEMDLSKYLQAVL